MSVSRIASGRIGIACSLLVGCASTSAETGSRDAGPAGTQSTPEVEGDGPDSGSAATGKAGDGGASGAGEDVPDARAGASAVGGTSGAAGAAGAEAVDLSGALYDAANFPRFDIELPPASIAALDQVESAEDPRQNIYVTATLTHGTETVTNIGLRFKGEGSFQKLDRKPAFKLKFDEFVDNQSFYGLRRMTLNNAFEDPSFVAERLAYDVFRAAGLPAPRCNSATVYVNGSFYGVYVNVEAEDKTFLRRWFGSDDGNLYEEGQRDFVTGAEQDFNLETNEEANDKSDLARLIASSQSATNPASFMQDIGVHLDTAQFLRFTAAEAVVNQWDMYAYTVFYVNNLRIYNDPTTQKFAFIPWGMDLSMKPFRDSDRAHIDLFALARQGDNPNGPISAGLIFQRCLQNEACSSAYVEAVVQIISAYQGLNMEARATTYYEQIRSQVLGDTRKRVCCSGGPLSNEQFEAGFQSVLTTIRGRVDALQANLAAR
jgi:spore coat protein CotH